jgi:hypothetical protein
MSSQDFARHVVADAFAIGDRGLGVGVGAAFQAEVAGQALGHVFADDQLVQRLQVGQAFEEQHALDQVVGVVHFLDRFLVLVLAQRGEAPVLVHAGMQEILVDRGQLIDQAFVEQLDDFLVAFHGDLLIRPPGVAPAETDDGARGHAGNSSARRARNRCSGRSRRRRPVARAILAGNSSLRRRRCRCRVR